MDARTAATLLCKTLQKNGHQAVFAGGCVRDQLLGLEPNDYDLATSATPDEVLALFSRGKAVGKAFGVVLVQLEGHEFEVATFRSDGQYSDGRHPDSVTFSNMFEDAKRRDFTINAMFFDPIAEKLIDFVGGKSDLEGKILRFVGGPDERIEEDNLRMLRFCRFAARLNFSPSWFSFMAVKMASHRIHSVAPERIREELMKMLSCMEPRRVIDILYKTHLLDKILPEVVQLETCEQSAIHHPEGNAFTHTLMVVDQLKNESPLLQLAALLHDIGKPATTEVINGRIMHKGHEKVGAEMADEIMRRLKFSNEEREHVVALVRDHMKVHVVKNMKKSTIKRLLSASHADDLIRLGRADVFGRNDDGGWSLLENVKANWTPQEVKPDPILTGNDLIEMSYKPGPLFKEILGTLQDEQLEDNIISKEDAIAFVKNTWPKC